MLSSSYRQAEEEHRQFVKREQEKIVAVGYKPQVICDYGHRAHFN